MVEQIDSNIDEPNVHESTVDYDRTKMLDSVVELCVDHNYIASCILSLIKSAYKVRVQVNSGLYDKFYCHNNELTSLEHCPEYVGGSFYCNDNNWSNPIPYELIKKFNIKTDKLYNSDQIVKFYSYEYQKEYLTNSPEKYKDLEPIGFNNQIKEEFDWLFNAIDMKLM